MDELKKCPFCGHTAHVMQLKQSAKVRYYIACGNSAGRCIASVHWVFGSFYLNKADAIEAWNRRVSDD